MCHTLALNKQLLLFFVSFIQSNYTFRLFPRLKRTPWLDEGSWVMLIPPLHRAAAFSTLRINPCLSSSQCLDSAAPMFNPPNIPAQWSCCWRTSFTAASMNICANNVQIMNQWDKAESRAWTGISISPFFASSQNVPVSHYTVFIFGGGVGRWGVFV